MGRRVGPKNKKKRTSGLMDQLKKIDYLPINFGWLGSLVRHTGILLLVFLVGFLFYDFYRFGMTSETFSIKLLVKGNQHVPADEIRTTLGPILNENEGHESLLNISAGEVRKRLKQEIPRFKSVYVLRQFPNQLMVEVTERTPVAVVARYDEAEDRRVFLPADEEGVLFEVRSGEWEELKNTLPVVLGLEELSVNSESYQRRWDRAMRVKNAFRKEFVPDMLTWIRIRPGGYAEIKAKLTDSLVIKLGLDNYHEKFIRLDEMMMTEEFKSIEQYINLRDLDEILVR